MSNTKYEDIGPWQYFTFILSLLAIILLAIQTFFASTLRITNILQSIDNVICLVFFSDFIWNLIRSRPLSKYLRWGWLDLLSSIPTFSVFRLTRFIRIARIIRVLRVARASKHALRFTLQNKARNILSTVAICSFILMMFATIGIKIVEPTMPTGGTFWWSIFTLIMGEYGEFLPITTEGRIITILLMISGMALFGTFTAYLASYFLEEEQKEDEKRDIDILKEIKCLSEQIAELRILLKGENQNGQHSQKGDRTVY